MASGAYPAPPRRRLRAAPARPAPEPHTEQFQPIDQATEAAFESGLDAPPARPAGWRGRPDPLAAEVTEVGVMPAVRPPAPDPDDEMEATGFHDPFADSGEMEATGFHDPFADSGEMAATGFHDPFAEDEDAEYSEYGEAAAEQPDEYDEYDSEVEPAEDGEPSARADVDESPAKQWLSMAVQLTLGVIGGAAVWLAFNWMWGKLPAAALAAAVVVIAGLVWVVRRIRRAEDIQTTVLAVLVGLVVTVSPAALLLLSR
jgi:hypothetical protein